MSFLYAMGAQGILDGSLPPWPSGTFKALLVSQGYTPNQAGDMYVSDIPSGSIVARTTTLTNLSTAGGAASAANITIQSVSGPTIFYIVIYEDTGIDATSRLVACIDSANGIPVTPNGGPVTIAWDPGPNKIFAI